MHKKRKSEVWELLSKLLWQPVGWHQDARTKGARGMTASARRELIKFKQKVRNELDTAIGHGTTSSVL